MRFTQFEGTTGPKAPRRSRGTYGSIPRTVITDSGLPNPPCFMPTATQRRVGCAARDRGLPRSASRWHSHSPLTRCTSRSPERETATRSCVPGRVTIASISCGSGRRSRGLAAEGSTAARKRRCRHAPSHDQLSICPSLPPVTKPCSAGSAAIAVTRGQSATGITPGGALGCRRLRSASPSVAGL